jgi:hypothetical protein
MLGKGFLSSLVVMNTGLSGTLLSKCEARGELLELKDIAEEEFSSSPSWIHGQARG